MDAQLLCFSTKEGAAFTNEIEVPGAGGMDSCTECSYTLDVANAEGSILRLLVRTLFRMYTCSEQALKSGFDVTWPRSKFQAPKSLNTTYS